MKELFSEFPKVSKEKWEDVLIKELKGADFDAFLKRNDFIEKLNFSTYTYHSDIELTNNIPGKAPYTRGFKNDSNDWFNASYIQVSNEEEANKIALTKLLQGIDSLIFQFNTENIDPNNLLQNIEFQFIHTQFNIQNLNQLNTLITYFGANNNENINFRLDFNHDFSWNEFKEIAAIMKNNEIPFCYVNGSEFQKTGANISQQLAFSIATGHEYLIQLIENGYTIEDAINRIHFSFGIGNTYFYEISKIRVFRKLWTSIIQEYQKNCTVNSFITAEITSQNKSLKDPYTNLLRQTTEVMSAISASVNTIIVTPYDSDSNEGESIISTRMAGNISLILKDESYFDKVIDPIGGSYSIESLTTQIANNAWKYFQKIDKLGGITTDESKELFAIDITSTVNLKLNQIKEGKKILIGINKFPNPQIETKTWKPVSFYLGLKQIIFERDI
ncbi:MAG: hypothetical protein HYR91_00770 [Flavobacteriia bacterium]|nr:hypothetical protein [Flavobacteriia bacterium]